MYEIMKSSKRCDVCRKGDERAASAEASRGYNGQKVRKMWERRRPCARIIWHACPNINYTVAQSVHRPPLSRRKSSNTNPTIAFNCAKIESRQSSFPAFLFVFFWIRFVSSSTNTVENSRLSRLCFFYYDNSTRSIWIHCHYDVIIVLLFELHPTHIIHQSIHYCNCFSPPTLVTIIITMSPQKGRKRRSSGSSCGSPMTSSSSSSSGRGSRRSNEGGAMSQQQQQHWPTRTAEDLRDRFENHIRPDVLLFNTYYSQIKSEGNDHHDELPRILSEEEYIDLAAERFYVNEGREFRFKECVPILHQLAEFRPTIL